MDFLTPARTARDDRPIRLPGLGIAAQPLPFLEFLTEETTEGLVLGRRVVLVRVPAPGRLAFHKLWTAAQRPSAEQVRARKDRLQAEALIEVLLEERPDEIRSAWRALARRKRPYRVVRAELERLPKKLNDRIAAMV